MDPRIPTAGPGLIDIAERFADVVESAQGHGPSKDGLGAKWLILPAAGAAAYAVATSSSSVARQTRKLMVRAKDRATDLPDADLFGRVKEVIGLAEQGSFGQWCGSSDSQTKPEPTPSHEPDSASAEDEIVD